jgi:hypothetical protein
LLLIGKLITGQAAAIGSFYPEPWPTSLLSTATS